ncbi:hypothetical protein EDI_228900 [Entamoeba dispar SAW760]|uniref:Uncharacterized protein n=1 Tax=Entamoeba dispar (strain ATCC PRA-260 / SAW760) TaxID=370354 RepID=B0ELS9_ENTDS|nr:uncharacterized protein EDI_228900 [Entamoeba dispar SAW760]EDR24522.1 hypothetical protein EDI_228900 [Entamoeba dispar SAW760]|eukprot:EDR24522.1 hypothetical protein EDI_228900 [Entamoeba dispar SAW760]
MNYSCINEGHSKLTPLCLPGPAHPTNVHACDWDYGLIAIAFNSIIYIINPLSCNMCYAYNGHASPVTSVCFKTNDFLSTLSSPNKSDIIIASGDISGKIHVWGIWSTSKPIEFESLDHSPVVGLQWDSCSSSALIVLYRSGTLICYDILSEEKHKSKWVVKDIFKDPIGFSNSIYARGSFGIYGGQSMCFCNLASSIFKGYELDTSTPNLLRVEEGVLRLKYSNIRRQVTYILLTKHFLIFDTALRSTLATIDLPEEPADFTLLYNEKYFALLTHNGNIFVYEIINLVQIRSYGRMEISSILAKGNRLHKYTTISIVPDAMDNSNLIVRMQEGPLILLKLTTNPYSMVIKGIVQTFPSTIRWFISKQIYSVGITEDGIMYVLKGGEIYRMFEITKLNPKGLFWLNNIVGVYGIKVKEHSKENKNYIIFIDPLNGEIKRTLKLRNCYGEIKKVCCKGDNKSIVVCYTNSLEEIEVEGYRIIQFIEKSVIGISYDKELMIIDKNEYKKYGSGKDIVIKDVRKGQFSAIATKGLYTILADNKGCLTRIYNNKVQSIILPDNKHISKIVFSPTKDCNNVIILGEKVIVFDVGGMRVLSGHTNYLTRLNLPILDVFWLSQYPAVLVSTGEVLVLDMCLFLCNGLFKETMNPLPLSCIEPTKRRDIFFLLLHGIKLKNLDYPIPNNEDTLERLIEIYFRFKDVKHWKYWNLMKWVVEHKLPESGSPYITVQNYVVEKDETTTHYSNALKNYNTKSKLQIDYHAFALSEMRLGRRNDAFTHFLKVLKSPYDEEYFKYAMRASLLSLTMDGNNLSRQRLITSLFNDPSSDKTHLIQLHKLLNQNREVCKLYIDIGKFEEAMVVSSLFLDDDAKTDIFLCIVLKYIYDNCWPKAIEMLTSMGRLIDVIRLYLYTGHVEMAAHVSMVIIERNLFDLNMPLNQIYQLIHVPNQDERKFGTLKELIRQVISEYIHCLELLPSNEYLVDAFKHSKFNI